MLETACRDFETLIKILRGETTIVTGGTGDVRSQAAIQMALAKSFVFYAVRAGRICEHGHQYLDVSREQRREFLKAIKPLLLVRDVNEHGFDPGNSGRGKNSRPSMHHHPDSQVIADETSMVISNDKILMGPLNLYTFYDVLNRMRLFAGFAALTRNEKNQATRIS